MKAESPGPIIGKAVPHMRHYAAMLYGIYIGMTALECILLLFGGMGLFDAINTSFATAGTGGFGIHNTNIAAYESYYLHMKELKKPTFIIGMVNARMKHYTGYDFKSGPGDVIHNYHGPLLMLHGTADKYSLPERTTVLYDSCPSEHKNLVWFEGGEHSKLRIAHTEQYDTALAEFVLTLENHISASN
jgi:hypothetical protein